MEIPYHKVVVNKIKKIDCDKCDYQTNNIGHLKQHIKAIHELFFTVVTNVCISQNGKKILNDTLIKITETFVAPVINVIIKRKKTPT